MALNLYKFHDNPSSLAGYENRYDIPAVLYLRVRDMYEQGGPGVVSKVRAWIYSHRDIFLQDPEVAVEAASGYSYADNVAGRSGKQLYQDHPTAVRIISQHPNSIARYARTVGQQFPEYQEQILKSSPSILADYVFNFRRVIHRNAEFLDRAFDRISEDPKTAYETAILTFPHKRLPKLESAIRRMKIHDHWLEDLEDLDRETINYVQTEDVENQRYYGTMTIDDLKYYGEFDSPWNFYVAGLRLASDREAAVAKYGFYGREFTVR